MGILAVLKGLWDDAFSCFLFLCVLFLCSALSDPLSSNNNLNVLSYILSGVFVIVLIITIISTIKNIIDDGFSSVILSIIINVVAIGISLGSAAGILSVLVGGHNVNKVNSSFFFTLSLVIFFLFQMLVSSISSLFPGEDDDDECEISDCILNILGVLRIIAICVGVFLFFLQQKNESIQTNNASLIILICVFVYDLVLIVIDVIKSFEEGFSFWDWFSFLSNVLLLICFVVSCFVVPNIVNIELSFINCFCLGFIGYFVIDSALGTIINLISNVADVVND